MARRKSRNPQKRPANDRSILLPDEKRSKSRKCCDPLEKDTLQICLTTEVYSYRITRFFINLPDMPNVITSNATFKFKSDTKDFSMLWKETDETNAIQEKSCPAACETPYEILHYLSDTKIFHFIFHSDSLNAGLNLLYVYINPLTLIQMKYASEPYINHHRNKLYKILQHFLKVDYKEYEDNYISDENQVQKLYKSISNSYNHELSNVSISHDFLIPSLRNYQMQAVNWMLKQEREKIINEAELHVLYDQLDLDDESCLFFHKYGGYFVNQKFCTENPCKGGILADEMGLGKTLEVLACILLNPRNEKIKHPNKIPFTENHLDDVTDTKKENEYSFPKYSDLHLSENSHFECVCGTLDDFGETKSLIICVKCHVQQHAECVLYKPEDSDVEYLCPHCWIKKTDLLHSHATLIVSPSAIIHQWDQEISRHVKKNCLKVFMYLGVENQKFVNPNFLANHDIVLTSYETFKKELDHANIRSGGSGHSLRHPKKFMSIPSPLCTMQWWRICLDEAQMVESVASKISKMAAKLHSVNRWCITGTPIQKSVEDLYGLILFLGFNPYQEKLWWKEVLWKPFINGKSSNISFVLEQIAWRTTKEQVLDQIGLPGLQEVIHKVDFTPIEKVYYNIQHDKCEKDFINKVEKLDALDIKLKSVDKNFLSKLLLPLRKLQQVCCHFQLRNKNFFDIQKNKMTMEELLVRLLKSTKYECEDFHRKWIMSMNGMAGILVIQKEFLNATEIYKRVLNSIEDNTSIFRTDVTQQIHTLFNLSQILSMPAVKNDGQIIKPNLTPVQLDEKMHELCETYLAKYKSAVNLCRRNSVEVNREIVVILGNFKMLNDKFPTSAWWSKLFQNKEDDRMKYFFDKLREILPERDVPGRSYVHFNSMISFGKGSFLTTLLMKSKDLYETRLKLISKLESISIEPTTFVLASAISCHLRPSFEKGPKCEYCEAEDIFNLYETKLFNFVEDDRSHRKNNNDEEEKDSDEENICFQSLRHGTHADSELEISLKWILSCCRRHEDLFECIEDGVNEMKLIEAMKKEFKCLRSLWLQCSEYVSKKDEIEMAKISARLLIPGESPPNPPVSYILHQHEVRPNLVQYTSDVMSFEFQLKKKMGQLFYLQNLKKAENRDTPFDESCPICKQKLEYSWSVLQCGHSFCLVCVQELLKMMQKFINSIGYVLEGIRCPLCREFTTSSDVYYIDNSNKIDDQNNIPIKGSYTAKVISVLRCLLQISKNDPAAKSLVFTSFPDFLCILEHAFWENNIKFLNLSKKMQFKESLENFKESTDINVLLIPLNFGCSGLNIIEATHVLLIEPVIDNSKHLQAIGRVHRIGQKRLATVHRFIVSDSIDENIHTINKTSSSESQPQQDLTIKDLKHLFESS